VKAYGKDDIGPGDLPRLYRSSTLKVYKKSISWSMPTRILSWDSLASRGNPTKSIEINGLLKDVLPHECCEQGATSRVKRATTRKELVEAIHIFYAKKSFQQSTRVTTLMILQISKLSTLPDIQIRGS
jgi:hypothetical protein